VLIEEYFNVPSEAVDIIMEMLLFFWFCRNPLYLMLFENANVLCCYCTDKYPDGFESFYVSHSHCNSNRSYSK